MCAVKILDQEPVRVLPEVAIVGALSVGVAFMSESGVTFGLEEIGEIAPRLARTRELLVDDLVSVSSGNLVDGMDSGGSR